MNSHYNQQASSGYHAVSQADPMSVQMTQRSSSGEKFNSSSHGQQAPSQHPTPTSLRKEPQISVEESHTRKEWRSWKLSQWFNAGLLLVEVGFVLAIIVLERRSVRDGGIATVPNLASPSGSFDDFLVFNVQQYRGLLWTSLPSLAFTLYALVWAALVAACYERQPFVELHRGSTARRTIMLDYRAYPSFYSWVIAFSHNHLHLGFAMLLSIVAAIVVVPLSAHLFVATTSAHRSNVSLNFATRYDDSVLIANTSLQSFVDIATAVHAYGSTPPPWMTTEYAFAPFSVVDGQSLGNVAANLTTTTDAYSAYLDCMALDAGAYTVTYKNANLDDGNDGGTVTVNMSDRSCSSQKQFTVGSNTPTYAITWQPCSGANDRFAIVSGSYSNSSTTKLADFSLVSCIPSYWHSTGDLTVSLDRTTSSKPNFVAFTEHNSTAMQPEFSNTFEFTLHQYTIFSASAQFIGNLMGFSILSSSLAAANQNVTEAMTPDAMKNATELVFSTVYAALANSVLLKPQAPTGGTGTLAEPVNRLFVVRPIAYTVVAILLLVLLSHLSLWVYTVRHTSVLAEEPIGLLGHAVLLERSDVDATIRGIKASTGEQNKIREKIEQRFDVDAARCFWDDHEQRIRVEGLS